MASFLRFLSLLAESIIPGPHIIPLQPCALTYWPPEEDE